ncbi:MAG: phage tail tape measure protein, partial [Rikenellaceae bacterium]|nr:phage tail tape measure protein [Rikenellaceae bacterium]
MAENAAPRVMSVLTVNYQPAVEATKQLMGLTAQLDSQLRSLRITAANVGRNMEVQFNRPIQSGQVILDRHGQVLIDVSKKTEALAAGTQKVDDVAKKHTKTVQQTAQAYSVLGSQWDRRISWFVAGAGFYGLIRVMRQAIDTFKQIEMDMVVIARTINDVTFNLEDMRDTLQDVGMQYGHTWDTVSDIAIRWTQAGYDMQDTLEQTRVGLLALNVAEMDVKMASEGLIAIMSQWGFTAEDLETVIDKLNITSDNFAVTTGDLVEALVRSSGAARAVKMSFDETLGIITATRVATGRLGREVGNAVNTILSFIVRQKTINKLMESGIEVFADAAQTKLRPAIELISDIAEKWGDKAEEMPDQLLEIAEQMGLMSEEMSEVAGLQEEWTDLQKIDIETSAAGVRRRSYFIALLRNFAQVQEVVNNLQGVEGYSMRQNIMTMEALEKKQEQLNIAMERFAVVLGESGLMEQLKGVIEETTELVEWFSNLDDTAKTLILTFAELAVAMRLLATLSKLMGGVSIATLLSGWAVPFTAGQSAAARTGMSALTASLTTARGLLSKVVSLLGGPYVAATLAATTAIVTFVAMGRRATEEQRRYLETINAVVEEQERLDNIMNKSVEGSTTYNLALEQKRELMKTIRERYPDLIEDYDIENRMWVLNNELIKENIELYEEMVASKKPEKSYLEKMEEELSLWEQESEQLKNNATTVESLFRKRENLIKSIEEEGTTAEEAARKKDNIRRIDEAIIRIIGDFDDSIETSADITETAIDNIIEKYRQKAHEAELSSKRAIKAHQAESIFLFSLVSSEKQRVLESLRATNQQIIAQEKYIESVMDAKTITEAYAITPPERA